ncbi:MAG: hypothetical protein ABJN35_01190 [Erythrobacter sp.]
MTVMEIASASDDNAPREVETVRPEQRDHSRLVLIALAIIALVQFHSALTRTINWDEFYFYGQIVDFTQGDTLRTLQTLHVQIFQWIPSVVSSGVDGIIIGRVVMWLCALITAGCVAVISGAFARRDYALTAALIWLAAGFTMQHGWSFRTDPLSAAMIAGSLAVLARERLSMGWILVAGALIGLAGMVTLKAALFAPAFAGLAWLRWSKGQFTIATAIRIAAVPVVAAFVFATTYAWHAAILDGGETAQAASYAGNVGGSMLFAGWPIYLHFAVKAAILSVAALAAIAVTLAVLVKRPRDEAIALAGLIAPLAALLIYRNTLPYFYPMMLAPVIAASVVGVAAIADRYGLRALIAYAALSGVVVWAVDGPSRIDQQRDIQIAADEIFGTPVGYFDFPDLLPAHRKANGFLTRWGIEGTYAGGGGYFRSVLEEETVPLLLTAEPEQNPTLLAVMQELPQAVRFRAEERDVLRATYRPFWGPFWLAGRDIAPGDAIPYEVMVPGPYTVTGEAIAIDGELFEAGDVTELERGIINLTNPGEGQAGIIWGDGLKPPQRDAPERPYWRGF